MRNCARTRTHTDALKKLVEEEAAAARRQREEDLDKNDNTDKDKDKEEEARLLAQEDKWAQVLAAWHMHACVIVCVCLHTQYVFRYCLLYTSPSPRD